MTALELVEAQEEWSFLLGQVGPVSFISTLIMESEGGQLIPQETQRSPDGRTTTRFMFADVHGGNAYLNILAEVREGGGTSYSLEVEPPEIEVDLF